MRFFPLSTIALLFCLLAPPPGWTQQIHCKPRSYAFGKVEVGTSSSYSFVLTNYGTKMLHVVSVSEQGASFSLGNLQLPAKVQPGASIQVPVTFAPTAQGEVHGIVKITSNDPNSPVTLNLHGTGQSANSAQLNVSPATLSFGNVNVGDTASLQATLTADGGPVTISSDATNSSEFSITGITLPIKIPAGKSVQATIQFTPNASGTADAKAGFISNAQDSPALEQLTGTGVASGSHQVDLSWDPSGGNVIGFNVYRGTVHGGPYQQINPSLDASPNYTDTSVTGGHTYYYVVTEVNSQEQQSGYSNETKAKIPKN